jgi:hypothetical protein
MRHGTIPTDADGRTYEIHHLDGDCTNNSVDNLVALSIKDHYDLHFKQRDWAECHAMAIRMNLSPEEISKNASMANKTRLSNGTHKFLNSSWQRDKAHKQLLSGTHNFIGPNSPTKLQWTCTHCGKSGKGKGNYTQHHGDNCKTKHK